MQYLHTIVMLSSLNRGGRHAARSGSAKNGRNNTPLWICDETRWSYCTFGRIRVCEWLRYSCYPWRERNQTSTSPAAANVTPTRPSQGYAEVEQFGAYTFDNYQNASGKGRYLQIGQQVVIACIEYDPNTTVTSTRGLWYQLVTPTGPRGEVVYAAANTFWNQDPPQPPDQDNAYDARVPLCIDSPSKVLPVPHG